MSNLEDLTESIILAVEIDQNSRRRRYETALQLGRLLMQARTMVRHGEWGEYLSKVGISKNRDSRYRKLAATGMTAQEVDDSGGIHYALGILTDAKFPDDTHSSGNLADPELSEEEGKLPPSKHPGGFLPDPELSESEAAALETESALEVAHDQIEELTGVRPPPARGPSRKDQQLAHQANLLASQAAMIADLESVVRQADAERRDGPEIDRYHELTAARAALNEATSAMQRAMLELADERAARIHRDRAIRAHERYYGCQISLSLPSENHAGPATLSI